MTVSTANTSITLGAHEPKKDRVVATGAPTVAATDVAVWARATVNTNLVQSIIGTFDVLFRYAKANLQSLPATGPTVISCVLGASEAGITVDGTPGTDECSLLIGADIVTKQQSHFLDRTCKRLREAWLEHL